MDERDLVLVEGWLQAAHVARWYLQSTTVDEELDDVRASLALESPTHLLVVEEDERPIGWCQWYRCDDYPEHALGVGAASGDVGIDYAIGEADAVGRGCGTAMIASLVELLRQDLPGGGLIADPDADNWASRRVLEKNVFVLVAERSVPSEATDGPMAIYRLPPPARLRPPAAKPEGRDA